MFQLLAFPSSRHAWNRSERRTLDQISGELLSSWKNAKCEYGVTDDGNPWMALSDGQTGLCLARIARIGKFYFLIRADEMFVRSRSLDRILDEVRQERHRAA